LPLTASFQKRPGLSGSVMVSFIKSRDREVENVDNGSALSQTRASDDFFAGNDRTALLFRARWPCKMESMKTPQQLSQEAIEEFRAIYREEFGRTLSDEEVQEMSIRLLRFFGILRNGDIHKDPL
jgi:hypothetical protein